MEEWEGRGSSGGSVAMMLGLRFKERVGRLDVGLLGGGEGGAAPKSAKEKDVGWSCSVNVWVGCLAAGDGSDALFNSSFT